MRLVNLTHSKLSVVAIPAHNEARYIGGCLAAVALQRDEAGAPVEGGSFEILILANNCSDDTAEVAVRQPDQSRIPSASLKKTWLGNG
jgi:glycosyltransferase involved in cell wall biosynthesis